MKACQDCTQAKAQRWWGGYSAACTTCSARAIARSLAAFNALHEHGNGNRDDLRDMVARMLPDMGPVEAKRAVMAWWRHDHEERTG